MWAPGAIALFAALVKSSSLIRFLKLLQYVRTIYKTRNQFNSIPIFGLMFWGILHFSRQSPWLTAAPGYQYQGVRAHSHSLPSLPSVKELADEYKQQYGWLGCAFILYVILGP